MDDFNIDKKSPEPLYLQISDWLTKTITSGVWGEGHKLPAEEDLARDLDISRGTLRKSIAVLIEQGLLVQIQGKGTFVAQKRISYPFAQELISFAETMETKGVSFRTKVLEKKMIEPNTMIQQKLQLEDDPLVLYLKRVRYIENEPAILLENWVALNRCPGIENVDFTQVSLFSAIEKHSEVGISHGIRNFTARSLQKHQAKQLQLEVNEPILKLEQVTFGEHERPLEHSQVYLRTDRYEVTSLLSR